jgi:hypothetical protein
MFFNPHTCSKVLYFVLDTLCCCHSKALINKKTGSDKSLIFQENPYIFLMQKLKGGLFNGFFENVR